MSDEIPRRCRLDLCTPAELAIYSAMEAVEALPADVRLTDAVVLLQQARNKVADFVDGVAGGVSPQPENRCTKCDQPILEEVLCGDCLYERDGPTMRAQRQRLECADELDAALRDSGGEKEPHWSERVQDYLRDARGVDEPCPACGGLGTQTYANTSTWRRGAGGSAMRVDVCDACWGSGDKYRKGANLRELFDKLAAGDGGGAPVADIERYDQQAERLAAGMEMKGRSQSEWEIAEALYAAFKEGLQRGARHSGDATPADRQRDIDLFWQYVENGWDIEPREYFEREARTNGFGSPLAMAAHHMWKRSVKEQQASLATGREEP